VVPLLRDSGGGKGIECSHGSTAGLTHTTPDGAWTYSRVLSTGATISTTIVDPQSYQTVLKFQRIYETERRVKQGASTPLKTTYTCRQAANAAPSGEALKHGNVNGSTQAGSAKAWPRDDGVLRVWQNSYAHQRDAG
jgi:hypothetical protein